MSRGVVIPSINLQLHVENTGGASTYRTVYAGAPVLAAGAQSLHLGLRFGQLDGTVNGKVAYRLIPLLRDTPDATVTEGSTTMTADDTQLCDSFTLSSVTDKMFVQPLIRLATASSADVNVTFGGALATKGMLLGTQRFVAKGETGIEPFGQPFPAAGATAIQIGVWPTDVTGTLTLNVYLRSCKVGMARPSAWSSPVLATTTAADQTVWNPAAIDITSELSGAKSLAQVGFGWSGSAKGILDVTAAVIW